MASYYIPLLKDLKKEQFRVILLNAIPLLKDLKKEQFRVILLNAKNIIIKEELISQGSLTSSIVHPREVINPAI